MNRIHPTKDTIIPGHYQTEYAGANFSIMLFTHDGASCLCQFGSPNRMAPQGLCAQDCHELSDFFRRLGDQLQDASE